MCLSADGATLTAHFSFDDASLLEACVLALQTLQVVDATAALHLSPRGVAAALKGCPLIERLAVAFRKGLSAQQLQALREAIPADARLDLPTEALLALPRPPALPFGAQPLPIASRGPHILAAVELMRAYPGSLFVQWDAAYEISWLSTENQTGALQGGACSALAAALSLHGPRGRAYGEAGQIALGLMLQAAQNCVAGTAEACAQFVAAGGVEGVAAALRDFPADHFGVATHGWGVLGSLAGKTPQDEERSGAMARMATAGLFATAASVFLSECRAPTKPRWPTFHIDDHCCCMCVATKGLGCCCCVIDRILCVVKKAAKSGSTAVIAAAAEAGIADALTALIVPARSPGWDPQSRAQVQRPVEDALEALLAAAARAASSS